MPRYGEDAVVDLRNRRAALHVARLPAGRSVALPAAPLAHVFVARGAVRAGTTDLQAGDAVRMTDSARWPVTAATDAELLVWEMHPDPR
jgi:redox-sensitive bicupin YhaK (pirin superfamily)